MIFIMKEKLKFLSIILTFFLSLGVVSCSQLNNPLDKNNPPSRDRGKLVDIGLKLSNKDISENQADKITIPIRLQNDESILYGIKVWRKFHEDPEEDYREYLHGIFDNTGLQNLRFRGYNLEEYKIETTLIKNETDNLRLFRTINESGIYSYYNPFNASLLNEFVEKPNDSFLPANYLSSMYDIRIEKDTLIQFNHGELERYFGLANNFRPDTTLKNDTLNVDLYRVSFGMNFEILGKELSEHQRVRVAVNMGKSPQVGKTDEIYTYILNNTTKKLDKVIAHGRDDDTEHDIFYTTMFSDINYFETFSAKVYLEILDPSSGSIIESIIIGDSEEILAKRNRRITYQITIPDHLNGVIFNMNMIDKAWLEEIVPFPERK